MSENKEIIDAIIDLALSSKLRDKNDFQKVQNEIYKKYKLPKPLASIEILNRYNERVKSGELQESNAFKKIMRKRGVRSLSGVTVVSLLTKFFGCPGKCVYCPTFEGLPKSYIPNEPAVMRAELNKFDPILQVHSRLRGLEVTGHKIEKDDVRIIGGTWSFYPVAYQEEFIKGIYDAFNTYDEMKEQIEKTDFSKDRFAGFKVQQGYKQIESKTLEEAKKNNETARCRVIGIAIETRPDWVNIEEIKRLRRYGVTRVEIGYQTTIDEINTLNKRGHGNKESKEATQLLKDAGFKVVAHMMPNLLGSTPELDKKAMENVFEDSGFRPDELKIYPMVVTDKSELTEIWKRGEFQAYDDETLIELMCELEAMIPEYVRINRTYRDIPSSEILYGSTLSNLRQIVEERMKSKGIPMREIRSREIKGKENNPEDAELKIFEYEASGGKEYFLTFEDPKDRTIFSLLRLRIPSNIFETSNIKECETTEEYEKLYDFFLTMWQEEFELDISKRKEIFFESKIFYFEEKGKIISAVQVENLREESIKKENIGEYTKAGDPILRRIGTKKEYRKKGLATKLIKKALSYLLHEKKGKKVFISAEIKNWDFYKGFGFEAFGEVQSTGNTKYRKMELDIEAYFSKKEALYKYFPKLKGAALIREIHTFGDQLSIGEKGSTFGQHIGFGKRLMEEAEKIAKEKYGIKKIAVIAGVGVRQYYEKRGYHLEGEYMMKNL